MKYGVRYMLDRKLKNYDLQQLDIRRPNCQVCGNRLKRLAFRLWESPYPWIPIGWWCEDCSIADLVW